MPTSPERLRELASQRRLHLIFVPLFLGADAWLLIETRHPVLYATEGSGDLVTIQGENPYWRSPERGIAILETIGLTVSEGSTLVKEKTA